MEKLNLCISYALVLASRANLCKNGVVVILESKFTPSRLISEVAEMRLEPNLDLARLLREYE